MDRWRQAFLVVVFPTEGIHWLTAAAARPGVDPWNMRDMDRIAATIFNS